jgi:hypothetical protein
MAMPCTAPAGAVTFNASGNLSGSASASAGVLQVNAKIIEANRMRRMVKSLSLFGEVGMQSASCPDLFHSLSNHRA